MYVLIFLPQNVDQIFCLIFLLKGSKEICWVGIRGNQPYLESLNENSCFPKCLNSLFPDIL